MPATNILQDFYQQKYGEVIDSINANPDLVNVIDSELGFSLFQLALEGAKPNDEAQPLINFIVTHPKFDFSYKKPQGLTNFNSIISASRVDVLMTVIKDPRILFIGDQLSYEVAKNQLLTAQKALQRDLQKNPSSKSSERGKVRVANLEEMVSLLRDATILRAMETDSPDLLTQLDKAGGEPTNRLGTLGNEKLPSFLIKPSNTNIKAWFKARSEQSLKSLTENPNSFYNKAKDVERMEAQLAELERLHLERKTEINKHAIDSMGARIDSIVASMS